jgi:hypothetical protein
MVHLYEQHNHIFHHESSLMERKKYIEFHYKNNFWINNLFKSQDTWKPITALIGS